MVFTEPIINTGEICLSTCKTAAEAKYLFENFTVIEN